MEGFPKIIAAAAMVGVLKGPLYLVLFWACSIPTVSPSNGRRVERAFWAALARVVLGVASTPILLLLVNSVRGGSVDWLPQVVQVTLRLLFWLGVALLVYRQAPFFSRGHRLYFAISVTVAGSLLNFGVDDVLFGGSLASPGARWGC